MFDVVAVVDARSASEPRTALVGLVQKKSKTISVNYWVIRNDLLCSFVSTGEIHETGDDVVAIRCALLLVNSG